MRKFELTEVSTNSMLSYPTSDNNIDSIEVTTNSKFEVKKSYLHTSPELEMKKLLANGSGNIYQICKVYRDNEIGKINFNEFVMLEYYLLGFNANTLSKNVVELFNFLGIKGEVYSFSYKNLFLKFTNIKIDSSLMVLKTIAKQHKLTTDFDNIADIQTLLFVHFIEEKLKQFPICIIYDFPKSQAVLAKINNGTAQRFEIYINGVEVANGYDELTTKEEYKERFLEQLVNSEQLDIDFLKSLSKPLPSCAGVAIGIDRLFSLINSK